MKKNLIIIPVFLFLLLLFFTKADFFSSPMSTSPTTGPTPTNSPQVLGQRTKVSGCVMKDSLPDKDCTPGAIITAASKEEICQPSYSSGVRNVSESTKEEVFKEYGITSHATGEYEVDHLISLELGGSNDIANLWPEPAKPIPGFHEKDKVENYLHTLLCKENKPLQDIQLEISQNWLSVYKEIAH